MIVNKNTKVFENILQRKQIHLQLKYEAQNKNKKQTLMIIFKFILVRQWVIILGQFDSNGGEDSNLSDDTVADRCL